MDNLYTVSLNLKGKPCVVIGGGKVSCRKVQRLLACGAMVKVVAPSIQPQLQYCLEEHDLLTWIQRGYIGPQDLEGASLVFVATDDPVLNENIRLQANQLNILVNVASNAHLGDFIVPATFSKGDLQISISTSGKVPGLSKLIKEALEDQFIPEYKVLIEVLEQVRQAVIKDSSSKKENLALLKEIVNDYNSILSDLTSGVSRDIITQKLLNKLI